MLAYVVLVVVGVPLFALVFTGVTLFLGLFWSRFKPVGEGTFWDFYRQFLIIAAVYMVLSFFGIGGLLGLAVMAFAYKTVFGAGWFEALVIGILGGLLGWILMIALMAGAIAIGLMAVG